MSRAAVSDPDSGTAALATGGRPGRVGRVGKPGKPGKPAPAAPGSRRAAWSARADRAAPYLFVSPAFLLLFAFGVLPIGLAALVSFTDLNVAGLGDLSQVHWVGFDNFSTLLAADSDFWPALGNTALFIVMGVPVIVVVSLAVAIGLNRSRNRLFRALRAFYFVPAVTGIVAVSLVFANLYNSQFGLLNHLLDSVGLPTVPWLADPTWAKVSVALVAVWRALGLNVIILLAAQQDIPREYYEAASLDGAGQARQAFSITIPLLRFALFFVTVTTLINWMQFFDEPFVLTGGGPVGATTSASLYIYKEGFESDRFGFASAASLVLFVLIFAVTSFQLWLARRAGERR